MPPSTQLRYWRFYWPLALTGLSVLIAQQFQNAALARYPNAAEQLATFALAQSTFQMFNAALIFVPQMVNVLIRTQGDLRVCLRFTVFGCLALSAPLVVLDLPFVGEPFLAAIFGIKGATLSNVSLYLRMLTALVLVNGLRHFYTGLLIQAKRTATVTVLNVVFLTLVVVSLVAGFHLKFPAVIVLASAQIIASTVHLILTYVSCRRYYTYPEDSQGHAALTYRETFRFFWPVALTSFMFSLSRPILYSFLGRLAEPAPVIAAMRVGFDFAMIFHNLLNQFRHLFVTFGKEDLAGVRRFMTRVTVVVVSGMVVVVLTPLSYVVLRYVIGVQDTVLVMSRQVLVVLCLLPVIVTIRNYFHGIAMVNRETGPMGAGAISRNVATYLVGWLLHATGTLNHVTAAATLLVGFMAETAVVIVGPKLYRQRGSREPAEVIEDEEDALEAE